MLALIEAEKVDPYHDGGQVRQAIDDIKARLVEEGHLPGESRVTPSNPTGEVRQCDRRDLHEPHEYQAEFGAYFNVYCPGNRGDKK
jgi:hypothetical protein